MYDIKADQSKNLLILKLEGFMSDEEWKDAADLCISEVEKLKPGFTVVNDIVNMKSGSPQGAEEIKRAQIFVVQQEPSKIIRVTGNPISKMQLSRTSKEVGYKAFEVESMEEALKLVTSDI